jgi:UDPglucose 6-dehydrogenase
MSKVVFYNHIKNIVDESGTKNSYEDIIEAIQHDERMGYSHMQVPGFGGRYGASGKCLSKDPNAFAEYAKSLGTSFTQLEASIASNEVFCPDVYDDGAFSVG